MLLRPGSGAFTQTNHRPPHKVGVRPAGAWDEDVPAERPPWCLSGQFKVTCSGLPLLSLISLDHIVSIWPTIFAGIGT
jgi:hypothetical protein